ncbi:hypothetical protein [Massilibacteroides vaginae]|uniref:hypothetical protein n=1 Tax=Massilibacteroides vaginae TaxID=1673718 RepID=UPI000A1CCD19|nr:hypothetical protein [Massilibacteroides vaginae]
MDKLISSHSNYSIWQFSETGLFNSARFIVYENYKHHQQTLLVPIICNNGIIQIYGEEKHFFKLSKVFNAKNDRGDLVGDNRIIKWNREDKLPIALSEGKTYLGSTTIPICTTRDGLIEFLTHNNSQSLNIEWEDIIET